MPELQLSASALPAATGCNTTMRVAAAQLQTIFPFDQELQRLGVKAAAGMFIMMTLVIIMMRSPATQSASGTTAWSTARLQRGTWTCLPPRLRASAVGKPCCQAQRCFPAGQGCYLSPWAQHQRLHWLKDGVQEQQLQHHWRQQERQQVR